MSIPTVPYKPELRKVYERMVGMNHIVHLCNRAKTLRLRESITKEEHEAVLAHIDEMLCGERTLEAYMNVNPDDRQTNLARRTSWLQHIIKELA